MSKIADTEANATSLDGLVNDNALVPTLRNGPKPSYQYLVNGWNTEFNALISNLDTQGDAATTSINADVVTVESAKNSAVSNINADVSAVDTARNSAIYYINDAEVEIASKVNDFDAIADAAISEFETDSEASIVAFEANSQAAIIEMQKSRGFRRVGTFEDGFTYELANDVGIDSSGEAWVLTDISSLPFIVPAMTTPTDGVYTKVTYNSAENIQMASGESVEKQTTQSRQSIEAAYKAKGYNNVFFFKDGFTYTEPNDVGVYEDGTAWTYADAGALPVTIAANTEPSEPTYNLASGSRWEGKYKTISIGSEVLDGDIIVDAITGSPYITYPKETIGVVTALDYQELTATIGGVDVFLVGATKGFGDALSWGLEMGESGSHERNTLIMLNRISKYLSEQGGYMEFPGGVVNFGFQNPDTTNAPNTLYELWGENSLYIKDATHPVVIEFKGTEFNYLTGYRFGRFIEGTNTPTDTAGKYVSAGDFFTAYNCENVKCTGSIIINMNSDTAIKGGQVGDTGIQLSGSGIRSLYTENFEMCISEVNNPPLDGYYVMYDGLSDTDTPKPHRFITPKCRVAGRNAMSLVGCNHVELHSPVLTGTGTGTFNSPPRAGIDFEAQGGAIVKNIAIYNPYIVNNGACMLVPFGSTDNVHVYGGKVIGGTGTALYGPFGGSSTFNGTRIVGRAVNQFGAHKFNDCLLSMDESLNEGFGPTTATTFQDFSGFTGSFNNCEFVISDTNRRLPSMSSQATVNSCNFTTKQSSVSFTRATFIGKSIFDWTEGVANDFNGAKLEGIVISNGNYRGTENATFKSKTSCVTDSGNARRTFFAESGFGNDTSLSGIEVERGERAQKYNISGATGFAGQVVSVGGVIGSTASVRNFEEIQ